MPPFGPISRRDLIAALARLGFEGPYAGGRHAYVVQGMVRVILPNPHRGDIGRALLSRIVEPGGVSRDEW